MPNPQFTKPWHGVPRDAIHWNPTIVEDASIARGTCVTGCRRLVYRFDFDRKKPVVIDPLNYMVGCTTCANTCPTHAITFPPIETVLAASVALPHPDRIVTLRVSSVEPMGADVLRIRLAPTTLGECFCEFTPGQYLELWQPGAQFMSRAYSTMTVGDSVQARGPLGHFTMRSLPETPLLFVAAGTGLAPVLSLRRQQTRFHAGRDMVLMWGAQQAGNFYALAGDRTLMTGRDIYAAGPRVMLRQLALELTSAGVSNDRVRIDSFGV